MSFQSGVNQAIGTIGALAGVGKMVKNQEKTAKLAELDAKEKAINEYVSNNEPATQAYDEHQAQVNEINNIDADQELWANEDESPQAMAFESAKQSVQNAISAKIYQNNLIRQRMQIQDERWKVLGVNKEQLKNLNSPEDQKKIHEFKKGVNW